MMKTVWSIYFVILAYYFMGTVGIYFINRKKEDMVKQEAWTKLLFAFIVTNIVFFSIGFNIIFFRILSVIIIIGGFFELFKLYRLSGYRHLKFFLLSVLILAVSSAGFFLFSLTDQGLILYSFLILSVFDGYSQITGQLFGKRKLFPKVSPHKTVEGLIGGTIIAVLSALVFRNLIQEKSLYAILLAAVIVVFAFAGDAVKSVYKRKYGVKNFSNLIPGNGGFLDRFDSLIATGAGITVAGLLFNL
ncbi:MAG: phosphatidate cytidylyltransferase [Bacteroidales bacterium]|jgi:phosphatidate cytidylyltransferase|nr:phosphatidate cytidylyltransferase [Bacteroidales bacterium]